MDPIRYGIIGAGTIARSAGRDFSGDPGSTAVAVADVDEEAIAVLR